MCSAGHDEDDGDDEAVESERLSEDHHQDERNQNILLSVGADTSITHNTDSETCGERGKTAAKTRCELFVAESVVIGPFSGLVNHTILVGDCLHCVTTKTTSDETLKEFVYDLLAVFSFLSGSLTGTRDDDRDDEAVNTEDTSHDYGNDGLDDELRLEDGDRADTDAGLGSSVGGTQVAENEGSDDAHTSEEKSLVGVSVHYTQIHDILG